MFYSFIELINCWAQESNETTNSALNGLQPILLILIMFIIFYFLMIRPQQKKMKAHKELLANLHKGDEIITSGGIYGKITGLNEQIVTLEITPQVRIKINRGYIAGLSSSSSEINITQNKK